MTIKSSSPALSCWSGWDRTMDTVGTGRAQQVRLSERQLGWRLPCPRRGRAPSISGTRFITSRTDRSFSLSSWYTPANLSLARRRGWRVHLATLRHLGFTHHCDPAPLCHPSLSIITLQYPPLALLSIVKKRSVSCVSVYTLSHTHIFRFSLHGEHGRGAGARFPEERNNGCYGID